MIKAIQHVLRKGDRVMVASTHPWLPQRFGTIEKVENRIGNRYMVKLDSDELGLWHNEDGEPVLRLGENDLVFVEDELDAAA
jgi:hypothetical protein